MYKELVKKFCDTILSEQTFKLTEKWCYSDGVVLCALKDCYEVTQEERYYEIMKRYLDQYIDNDGNMECIQSYPPNVDRLNNGKVIFAVYNHTNDSKYLKPLQMIRNYIDKHPRLNNCQGFAHKEVYDNQMWLDGLYMLQPLYAQFAKEWGTESDFDDIAIQFKLITEFCYHQEKQLYYHAYDHTKSMFWADSVTGRSPHFWGRAMGWLAMAAVDTLDFFPVEHAGRDIILDVIDKIAKGIQRYQSTEGLWYQILDLGEDKRNYLESSCSCMFLYFLKKSLHMNYLDDSYEDVLNKAYNGIFTHFITTDDNEIFHIHQSCKVAGLGPANDTRRDGSFEYYMSEPIVDDDSKAFGALLSALVYYAKEK